MSGPFGATSTTDEVLAGIDLKGKRVLVTGVSAGLGVETARAKVNLALHVLGRTGQPWCRPGSPLQAHAAWHVVSAAALWSRRRF